MKSVTISSKGQISIPKEVRKTLHIKEGDQLIYMVKGGKIILEPVINIPRSQAWFWTKEVQSKIRKSESDFETGNFKSYKSIDDLIKYLE